MFLSSKGYRCKRVVFFRLNLKRKTKLIFDTAL